MKSNRITTNIRKKTESLGSIQDLFSPKNGFGEHRPLAIELLKQTINILNKYEIKYCLISGTLLGQVRHNDFIPWDDDIDLLVDCSIFDKMKLISEEQNEINLFFKNVQDSVKVCFKNNGIEIPSNGCSESWKDKCLSINGNYTFPFMDLFAYKQKKDTIHFFHKSWNINEFFPLQKVDFLGIETFIPKNPSYFLSINYGPSFMTILESSPYCHKKEQPFNQSKKINIRDLK